MMPPSTGEITQLEVILPIDPQLATPQPPAAMPAPKTPPTIEWVVDTGAPTYVAKFSHSAPALAYNRARNEFLVVWERYDGGASLTDIYGRLVTGNGQPLQPTSIEYARMTVSNTKPAVTHFMN